MTVDAQGASGAFAISEGAVWLNGLTVTGGKATDGGGINIQPRGLLDFSDGAIRGNEAERGGGLFNSGVLTLWDVTVADNTAAKSGGGLNNEEGDVTLYNVRLSGNGAQWGGGLSNALGIVEVFDATVSGNSAAKAGGGLSNYYGEMTLTNTTVSGNSAVEEDGGGLYSEGTTTLTNVTLSGNGAQTWGGGISHRYETLSLTNVTVSGNNANQGGGLSNSSGTATLTNTIVLGNEASSDAEARGTLSGSSAHNLIGDGTVAAADVFAAIDSATGGGLLADNGGAVRTIALRADPANPALGSGDDAAAPPADARYVGRRAGEVADLGAFDLPTEEPSLRVTTAADVVDAHDGLTSLREALAFANAVADADGDGQANDAITFASGAAFEGGVTIALTQGQLMLASDVTIAGDLDGDGVPDVTIDAQGASRVIEVTGGTATLSGLTVTGGRADYGGGIHVSSGATLAFSGGAILDNEATVSGGGIGSSGTMTLTDAAVSGNHAGWDGGGVHSSGKTALNDVMVWGNDADQGGGGIMVDEGETTLEGGFVSENRAKQGGGIAIDDGEATLDDLTVAGNDAEEGGGLYNGGIAVLTGSTVSENRADRSGGGLYNSEDGFLGIRDSTVSDNYAVREGGGIFNAGNHQVLNVTMAGNDAIVRGGGLHNADGMALLENLTLSNNGAAVGGGVFVGGGLVGLAQATVTGNMALVGGGLSNGGEAPFGPGGLPLPSGVVIPAGDLSGGAGGSLGLVNSIVLGNAHLGAEIDGDLMPDSAGNLIGDGTVAVGDVFAALDPATGGGLLADNGGQVETVALRADAANPALDAGLDLGDPPTDARGLSRVFDLVGIANGPTAVDLGAFEVDTNNPRAQDDAAIVAEGEAAEGGVLGNDADPDADALVVSAVAGAAASVGQSVAGRYGSLRLRADGSYRYEADAAAADALGAGERGEDAFAYTVSDGRGGIDEATLAVTVVGRDEPVARLATPATGMVAEGSATTFLLFFENAFPSAMSGPIGYDWRIATTDGGATGGDFAGVSGSGTFDASAIVGGRASQAITIEALTDGRIEGPEVAFLDVTLSGVAYDDGARTQRHEITILDVAPTGGPRVDIIRGSDGADAIRGRAGDDRLLGRGGDDALRGNRGDDEIGGGQGDDALWGNAGRDEIAGNAGRDTIRGGAGGDLLRGGAGDDVLRGNRGDDRLRGGQGQDVLRGGAGDDALTGGAGADTFVFQGGMDRSGTSPRARTRSVSTARCGRARSTPRTCSTPSARSRTATRCWISAAATC